MSGKWNRLESSEELDVKWELNRENITKLELKILRSNLKLNLSLHKNVAAKFEFSDKILPCGPVVSFRFCF